jgi:hypothetical protein
MTDVSTLTGQDIGQAERATRAVLDSLLARIGTTFHQWVVLNTVVTNDARAPRALVVQRLVSGLKVDEAMASAVVNQLVEVDLATAAHGEIVLTPSGVDRFELIRDGIAAITNRLYGGIPIDQLQTARHVLALITERANAELATSEGTPKAERR